MATKQKKTGIVQQISSGINEGLSVIFSKIGRNNGERPYLTILFCFIFAGAFGYGLSNFVQESRAEKLWVAQGTQSQINRADLIDNFGSSPRIASVILLGKEDENLLAKDKLAAAFDLELEIFALNASTPEPVAERDDRRYHTLSQICLLAGPFTCVKSGIIGAWDDVLDLDNDTNIIDTINNAYSKDELINLLADPVFDTNDKVISAQGYRLTYLIQEEAVFTGSSEIDVAALAWENLFLDLMLQRNNSGIADLEAWKLRSWNEEFDIIQPFASRTFGDEFGSAVSGDVAILGASYMLIIGFSIIVFSKWDRILTGFALAGSAVLCCGLAIISAFGASQLLGYKYGQVHSVLPFIVLGIGIDDSFVIYNAWANERKHKKLDLPSKMSKCMAHAGTSVTITSLTNALAFGIGSSTVIPDFSSFCVYASLAIFFLWIYQITAFSAFCIINERRIMQNRLDFFCCFKDCRKDRVNLENNGEEEEEADDENADNDPEHFHKEKRTFVRWFLGERYGPFIMQDQVRYVCSFLCLASIGFCAYNITNFTVQATGDSFIPDASYAKTSISLQDQFFSTVGTPVSIITLEDDYFLKMDALKAISVDLTKEGIDLEVPYINQNKLDSWFDSFVAALERHSVATTNNVSLGYPYWEVDANDLDAKFYPKTSALFYKYLREYLDDVFSLPGFTDLPGIRYSGSIVFEDETRNKIIRSQITTEHVPIGKLNEAGDDFIENAQQSVAAMNKMYDLAENSWDINCYPYSFTYTNDFESYEIVEKELTTNLLLALASIFVVTTLLLGHLGASIIVFLSVAITITQLLGLQPLLGLAIDTVSVVLFLLACGLAVDYSSHIVHAFMTKRGSDRKLRVIEALDDVGVPILNGAISTFLAICLQGLSNSYVFRVIFLEFFFTVLLGIINGLLMVPILLSFFGPEAYEHSLAQDTLSNSNQVSDENSKTTLTVVADAKV